MSSSELRLKQCSLAESVAFEVLGRDTQAHPGDRNVAQTILRNEFGFLRDTNVSPDVARAEALKETDRQLREVIGLLLDELPGAVELASRAGSIGQRVAAEVCLHGSTLEAGLALTGVDTSGWVASSESAMTA